MRGITDAETWLAQFAVMGSAFSHAGAERTEPVVGLLTIGNEDCIGQRSDQESLHLIQR
jgi:fatty acid/phospholipid biosynthesis enzyme